MAGATGLEPATSGVTGRRSARKNNGRFDSRTGKSRSKAPRFDSTGAGVETVSVLEPRLIYALSRICAAGRLYRFGSGTRAPGGTPGHYRLDRGQPHQDILVSGRAVEELEALGLVLNGPVTMVPGSTGYAQHRTGSEPEILAVVPRGVFPEIWREWNELPLWAVREGAR